MAPIAHISQSDKNIKIEEAIRKDRKRLLSFIRKRVKTSEDAEDILQDVFYQLSEGVDMIGSIDRISSWLFSVARNKIIDLYRKKKPENFSEQKVESANKNQLFFETVKDKNATLEDEFMRKVIMDQIQEALEELPAEQREAFILHEIEDFSFQEISELKNVSVNTLISRKRYATIYLRKRLKDLYNNI